MKEPQEIEVKEEENAHHHHHHHHHHHRGESVYSEYLFLGCILSGIYVFFLMFGYYQEKLYSMKHPLTGERFSYSCFLVLTGCISNAFFSFLLLLLQHRRRALHLLLQTNRKTVRDIILISLSYCVSMLSTNYALTHINYPTQILVKSAKMVPVVVGGFIFFGKTYPWQDYLSVFVLTLSLVVFQLCKTEVKAIKGEAAQNSLLGLVALCVSLLCDGLTGPRQDKLLEREKHISPLLLMLLTNACAVLWAAAATAGAEGMQPLYFFQLQGDAAGYLFAFAVCGSLGQLFIYQSIKRFGSLYTSMFTTLRKAASTLFSVYIFGHKLNSKQWIAFAAAFGVILLQTYVGKKQKNKHKKEAHSFKKVN